MGNKLYSVRVSDFDPVRVEAETASKARWQVFTSIREAGYITDFQDFLSRVSVLHLGPTPPRNQ